jgi:hypothetical protein
MIDVSVRSTPPTALSVAAGGAGGAARGVRAVCVVDHRLRRIPDMDASDHRMTN